jgi:hypothetical protein
MKLLTALMLLIGLILPAGEVKPQSSDMLQNPNNLRNSGTEFLLLCSTVDDILVPNEVALKNNAFCFGWASGVFDAISVETSLRQASKPTGLPPCQQQEITNIQVVHIIKKYITDHPETENLPTAFLATQAVKTAFPCLRG